MRTILIFFGLVCCLALMSAERTSSFAFSSLKLKDGLSQLTVSAIYQDKRGFLWLGTRNGLNRYDGNSFVVYKHDNRDSSSLSSNHILALVEDNQHNLWIATANGLNRLDLQTNKMYSYNTAPYAQTPVYRTWIQCLYVDKQGVLWIGSGKGLIRYDKEKEAFLREDWNGNLPEDYITAIGEDHKGNFLIGTFSHGLYIWNKAKGLETHYEAAGAPSCALTDNHISVLLEEPAGILWVGTHQKGLNRIDTKTHIVRHYTAENGGLGNNAVRSLVFYNGQVIVGSYNGLSLLDLEGNLLQVYTNFDEQQKGLSHFSIVSSFVDNANTLWVGTYSGGVNYSNPLNNRFRFYDLQPKTDRLFGIFSAMEYDKMTHTLWIASEGRGLLAFHPDTGSFEYYLLDTHPDAWNNQNVIKSLFIEGDGIWCGTQKGTLYRFDLRTKKFSLRHSFHKEISIYTIDRCKDGALWLGTTDDIGITRLLPDGKAAPAEPLFKQMPSVRSFLEVEEGVYLIGTHVEGLMHYDSRSRQLTKYNTRQEGARKLLNDQVTSLVKDKAGRIWVGTFGGGFCRWEADKGIVEYWTTAEGLSNDDIQTILPAQDGTLWLSTGNGISAFDPDTRRFENYTGKNEIPVNEFSLKGGIQLPDGLIFFSGNNGLVSFDPARLEENRFIPPIAWTSFTVNNKRILPGDTSGLLAKELDYTQQIELDYDQNNLSFGYVALNYIYPNQNQYAYILDGYDEDWNYVGSRKEAFYTNLKPGDYVFRVKASNNDGIWNETGRSLAIHIRAPFWATGYACLFYLLLLSGATYVVWHYLHVKRKLERDLIEKQREQQRQEEFHQSKIRMFTNFSHELRTPLMLILSPLEEVLQRVDMPSSLKETLHLVYGNAQRLLNLVNQLLDLRKNQNGSLQLRIAHSDLYLFIQEIYVAFNQIAAREQVELRLESDESQLDAWFDGNLLEKVVFNLLSNAFKHTSPGESVTIRLRLIPLAQLPVQYPVQAASLSPAASRYVCLSVEDTGDGIAETDKPHVFAPFYQGADEANQEMVGTGIGLSLVLSIVKLHQGVVWVEDNQPKGAAFHVLIPIDKEAYSREQWVEDSAPSERDDTKEHPEENAAPAPLPGPRRTLLLAEDNAEVRRYVKARLEPYYEVLEAGDGVEAFNLIAEALPDLVISDIMMPKKDGLQLCAEIKQDLRTGHIPVIIITAKSMVMHIKEGFQHGADDYMVKPFNMDILLYRIRNLLASRERLKELYGKKFSLASLGIDMNSADDRFMQKLFAIIEQHLSNPDLSVEVLCREIGMGRANFYRKLKAVAGLSPMDLIRDKRLEIAAKMLRETRLTVSEIATRVGFNSQAYFATCFKAMFGMSPTEYKSNH